MVELVPLQIQCATNKELKTMQGNQRYTAYYHSLILTEIIKRNK